MASFRFVVVNGDEANVTQWQKQEPPSNGKPDGAAIAIGKIRKANPSATIYTEHNDSEPEELNTPNNGDTSS